MRWSVLFNAALPYCVIPTEERSDEGSIPYKFLKNSEFGGHV